MSTSKTTVFALAAAAGIALGGGIQASPPKLPLPEDGTLAAELVEATATKLWGRDGTCKKSHRQWIEPLKADTCLAVRVNQSGAWMVAVEDELERHGITDVEWRTTTDRMLDILGLSGGLSATVEFHYATIDLEDRRLILFAVTGSGVVGERLSEPTPEE